MKRIIICSDGTWNGPEKLNKKQYPTNVIKFARGIAPKDENDVKQVSFLLIGVLVLIMILHLVEHLEKV